MNHMEFPLAADRLVELRAALFSLRETRPAHHIYFLFDNACPVASDHPLHPAQLAARPMPRKLVRLPGPPGTEEWQPSLLQFYEAGENGYVDETLLALSLATACERHASINGAYMAAWVGSELGPDEFATRLARNCELFDLSAGRHRRVPIYEPYRMALLIGDPEAVAFVDGFLAKMPLWAFVDSAGALRLSVCTAEGRHAAAHDVRMSRDLGAAQGRVSIARLALLGLAKADAVIPAQIERRIDALLIEAEREGLAHPEDVVFFVLNSLSLSPHWYFHPAAKRCIARAVSEAAPLSGLMTELPDAMLDEIGAYRVT